MTEILKILDYPDNRVASEAASGFNLVGTLPDTGVFLPHPKHAIVTREELARTSKWAQHVDESSAKTGMDNEVKAAVHKLTVEEKENGWASGPWTKAELVRRHGKLWIASPRCGIKQGDKSRCVDDFSVFMLRREDRPGQRGRSAFPKQDVDPGSAQIQGWQGRPHQWHQSDSPCRLAEPAYQPPGQNS
jgi:hypothetical protein